MTEGLKEGDVDPDPIVQFRNWFAAAVSMGGPLPEAVTLATATPDGRPSARIVLMKAVDQSGFTFYSNYESGKGSELAANPRAALVFYWVSLRRQVRVTGVVRRVAPRESDAYFASRPYESRLSALASEQSRVIADRTVLERRVEELRKRYPAEVPRPPGWGGYRLEPEMVEFWLHRDNRLHDRLRYSRGPEGAWKLERLSP